MTIKISEVRAAFEARTFKEVKNEDSILIDEDGDEIGRLEIYDDGECFVATHNAMPVFLEIVEAALAVKEAAAADNFSAIFDSQSRLMIAMRKVTR